MVQENIPFEKFQGKIIVPEQYKDYFPSGTAEVGGQTVQIQFEPYITQPSGSFTGTRGKPAETVQVVGTTSGGGVRIINAAGVPETVPPSILQPVAKETTTPIQDRFIEMATPKSPQEAFQTLVEKSPQITSLGAGVLGMPSNETEVRRSYAGGDMWNVQYKQPSGEIITRQIYQPRELGFSEWALQDITKTFTPKPESTSDYFMAGLAGTILSPLTLTSSALGFASELRNIKSPLDKLSFIGTSAVLYGENLYTFATTKPLEFGLSLAGGIIGVKALTSTLSDIGVPSLLQWKAQPSTSTLDQVGTNVLTPKGISIATGTEEVGSSMTQSLELFGKIPIGITRVSEFTGDLAYGAMGKDIIPTAAKGFGITQYKYEFLGHAFKYGYEAPYIETVGFQWTSIGTTVIFPFSQTSSQEAYSISQMTTFTGKNIGFGYSISKVTPTLLSEQTLNIGDKNVMEKISVMSSEGRPGTISFLKPSSAEWKPFGEENLPYQAIQKQFDLEGQTFKVLGSQFKEFGTLKDKTFGQSLATGIPSGSLTGKTNILSIEPIMTTGSASGSATIVPFKLGSEFLGGLGGVSFGETKIKLSEEMKTTAQITSTSLWAPFTSKMISDVEDVGVMKYPTGVSNIITTTEKGIQPQTINQIQNQLLGQTQTQNIGQSQISGQTSKINFNNIQKIGQISTQGMIQNIGQTQLQSQTQLQKQVQQLSMGTSVANIIETPTPFIPPFIPFFGVSDFGFGKGKKWNLGEINLKTKYKPSLMAIGEGIFARGRTPKLVSGFGLRPIYGKQRRIRL